jgi:pimeloyl-ACP methyl ester carboxylesterase
MKYLPANALAKIATMAVALFFIFPFGQITVMAADNPDATIDGLKAKFVDVNGIRTRYYEYGKGEPVVMIHGGAQAAATTANVFSRNILGLAKHFHVFAMDRLACGMTGNPKDDADYNQQGEVNFIYAFIRTMKLGQVHLIGHSAGGGLVFYLAVQHPEIVRTLTILAMGPEDPPSGPTKLDAMLKKCADQTQYEGLKCRLGLLAWLPDTFPDEYWEADRQMSNQPKSKEARAKLAVGTGKLNDFPAWRKQMWDRARLDGVLQMPVLMVAGKNDIIDWGENDATANLQAELGLFDIVAAKNVKVQMIVYNNGGHFMYREHPEQFNQDYINFVDYWEHHLSGAPPMATGPLQ